MKVRCFLTSRAVGEDANSGRASSDAVARLSLTALKRSCLFVPLVSEHSLAPLKRLLSGEREIFLQQMELATAGVESCQKAKPRQPQLLVNVLPVLIGKSTGVAFDFAQHGGHRFPETQSSTSSTGKHNTVRETMNRIFAFDSALLADAGSMQCFPSAEFGMETDLCKIISQVGDTNCIFVCLCVFFFLLLLLVYRRLQKTPLFFFSFHFCLFVLCRNNPLFPPKTKNELTCNLLYARSI